MKVFQKSVCCAIALVLCILLLAGCGNVTKTPTPEITVDPKITPAPTEVPADIDASTVDFTTQTWVALEISFESSKPYTKPLDEATLDVVFTSPAGVEMKMPGFWDGATTWRVRFAPTTYGVWTYKTICSDTENTGLNGKTGKIASNVYKGDLAIYKHGFVKTEANVKYFMYDDGTPFFYMGDTHWNLPSQPFDKSKIEGIPSQFKYIVDKRVTQGFTVYQSEPIGAQYSFVDGVTERDIKGLRDMDARFKYIADKGIVHANAQLFFSADITGKAYTPEYLAKLARLWVARFGAYPVMWTTAQECDNDFYHGRLDENGKDMQPFYDADTNPWKIVAAKMHEYDPYGHPLTAHQEYSSMDASKGGVNASSSAFKNIDGHSWFGAQWTPGTSAQLNFQIPMDFWNNGQGKPVVNYEGSYDHLWTLEFGARQQGWTAYLNGMFGQGYGAADIWLYNGTYDMATDSVRGDVTITVADKKIKWNESVDFPAATQLGTHMRSFFNTFEWWKLVPCFADREFKSIAMASSAWYSAATIGTETYVAYFYNKTVDTGKFVGLESGKTYTAKWFNPRNGEYTGIADDIVGTLEKSFWKMPEKPNTEDWVIILTINQ